MVNPEILDSHKKIVHIDLIKNDLKLKFLNVVDKSGLNYGNLLKIITKK